MGSRLANPNPNSKPNPHPMLAQALGDDEALARSRSAPVGAREPKRDAGAATLRQLAGVDKMKVRVRLTRTPIPTLTPILTLTLTTTPTLTRSLGRRSVGFGRCLPTRAASRSPRAPAPRRTAARASRARAARYRWSRLGFRGAGRHHRPGSRLARSPDSPAPASALRLNPLCLSPRATTRQVAAREPAPTSACPRATTSPLCVAGSSITRPGARRARRRRGGLHRAFRPARANRLKCGRRKRAPLERSLCVVRPPLAEQPLRPQGAISKARAHARSSPTRE